MNAAELIVETLEKAGVEYIFGIPGGAIEDLNTAIYNSSKITPIVSKHEEGAAFMADGYARVSGRLGVCCSTAGPGASNMITGLASSFADSIPVCALTGQVSTSVFGKGAIQESGSEGVNIVNIFRNFTKYSGMVINEKRARHMIEKAVRIALTPPTGPTHLSLPSDMMKKQVEDESRCRHKSDIKAFDREGVRKAAELLVYARRPAIIAGWGVALSDGEAALLELAELLNIPVATSPKAKGVFPESHPLSLGVLGFAGSPVAKAYIIEQEVDVLLAVGTSFNEMMTGGWDVRLRPSEHLIQIDVDPEEIGKNYCPSVGLVGNAETVLTELIYAVAREIRTAPGASQFLSVPHLNHLEHLKARHPFPPCAPSNPDALYSPKSLVRDLQRFFPQETVWFADMGTTMAWAIRYLVIDRPHSFFLSLGFSSMGYAVAAPVGAKLAVPDRPVVSIVGDGSFLMNGTEVATAANYDIPAVWVIFNNAMLGMVYHGRKLFKNPIPEGIPSRYKRVDFAKVAEGLGARGITVDRADGLTQEMVNDIVAAGRPTVIDVWIDEEEVPPIHSRIETVDKHFSA